MNTLYIDMSFGNWKYSEMWCYISKQIQHLIRDVHQCNKSLQTICRFGGNSIVIPHSLVR